MKTIFFPLCLLIFLLPIAMEAQIKTSKFSVEAGAAFIATEFAPYDLEINDFAASVNQELFYSDTYPKLLGLRLGISYHLSPRFTLHLAGQSQAISAGSLDLEVPERLNSTYEWPVRIPGDLIEGNYEYSSFSFFRRIRQLVFQGRFQVASSQRHKLELMGGIGLMNFRYSQRPVHWYYNEANNAYRGDGTGSTVDWRYTPSLNGGLRYQFNFNRFFSAYLAGSFTQTFYNFEPRTDRFYNNLDLQAGVAIRLPAVALVRENR